MVAWKDVFTSGQTVANTTLNSSAMDTTNFIGLSAQLTYTGASLAGSAKLQGSNDGTNWFDVASSSQSLAAAGGVLYWTVADVFWMHSRMVVISTDADVVTITVGRMVAKMPGA